MCCPINKIWQYLNRLNQYIRDKRIPGQRKYDVGVIKPEYEVSGTKLTIKIRNLIEIISFFIIQKNIFINLEC